MPRIDHNNSWSFTDADSLKTPADEIVFGAEGSVSFYEVATNVMRTDDDFRVGGDVEIVNVGLRVGSTAHVRFTENASDVAAPAANAVALYARDNGVGKTQLVARFATGAVQVLATEP